MADEQDRMFRWLHTDQVGCHFAMALTIKKQQDRWRVISGDPPKTPQDVEVIHETLVEASGDNVDAVILIFPAVELLEDLVKLINFLGGHDSWDCTEDKQPDCSAAGRARLGLGMRWQMPCGTISFALGFGPFGFLPPTRRSPYTAITLPVCQKGVHRKGDESERHLCDMANDLWDTSKFDSMMSSTSELKATLIGANDEQAAKAKVTFALPEDCRGQLNGLNNN